jgi:hypothetical protein
MGDKATTPPTPPLTAMLREAGDDSRPRCGAQPECARQAAKAYAATLCRNAYAATCSGCSSNWQTERCVVKPRKLRIFLYLGKKSGKIRINIDICLASFRDSGTKIRPQKLFVQFGNKSMQVKTQRFVFPPKFRELSEFASMCLGNEGKRGLGSGRRLRPTAAVAADSGGVCCRARVRGNATCGRAPHPSSPSPACVESRGVERHARVKPGV